MAQSLSKLYIFDYDRTIAETENLKTLAQQVILEDYLWTGSNQGSVEQPWQSIEKIIIDALTNYFWRSATLEEIDQAKLRRENEVIRLSKTIWVEVYVGIPELLKRLHEHFFIALVTGNTRKVGPYLLEAAWVNSLFHSDFNVYWDEFPNSSRSQAIQLCIDRVENCIWKKLDSVIYVWDARSDIIAWKEAWVKTIALAHSVYAQASDLMLEQPDIFLASCEDITQTYKSFLLL